MTRPPLALICDDEPQLRELMRVALGGRYATVEAEDAEEALEMARRERPTVILIDLMLPGRSGIDLLQDLRGEEGLGDVPIVVVSAWADDERRREAEEAGADAFVSKPFDPDELARIVSQLVEDGR